MKLPSQISEESVEHTLTVNGQRLWGSLMDMAAIGATEKGGCNRQALTDLDRQARDLFIEWAQNENCDIRIDEMGNVFARRSGKNNKLPAVMTGSHIDTQPTGGKFDGVYGVMAGLEVIRSLNDQNKETLAPVEVCIWTNEEGARFSPAMIGSGVWSGEFELQYGHQRVDKLGETIKSELERIGYLGAEPCKPHSLKSFFELHIEQGPILENNNVQIGIVNGVQGMRWYDLIIKGEPVHAGPTPMDDRRDPFMVLHKVIASLYEMAESYGPQSRVTFGDIKAIPGARNTVPEALVLAVDLRHPDQNILEEMDSKFRDIAQLQCNEKQLGFEIRDEWQSPAISFDENCVAKVRHVTERLGYTSQQMFSGAGHDAVYVSRVAPTAMIFIPCEKGISHNEKENISQQDAEAGCTVLLNALVEMANQE